MNPIVSASDYVSLPFKLPMIDEVEEGLTSFIVVEQEDILRKILGHLLYSKLNSGLSEETPDDKWIKIRDGAEFSFSNVYYKYYGLKSIIKPYIYYRWLKKTYKNHAGNGIVVPDVENGEPITPKDDLLKAWNSFSFNVGTCFNSDSLLSYLYHNRELYDSEFSETFLTYLMHNFKIQKRLNEFDF